MSEDCIYYVGVANCKYAIAYKTKAYTAIYPGAIRTFCVKKYVSFLFTALDINGAKWLNASAAQDASIPLELGIHVDAEAGHGSYPSGLPALKLPSLFAPDSLQ